MSRPFISLKVMPTIFSPLFPEANPLCIVEEAPYFDFYYYGIKDFMEAAWKTVGYRCSGGGTFSYTFNGPDGPQFERFQDSWSGKRAGGEPRKMSEFVCGRYPEDFGWDGTSVFTQDSQTTVITVNCGLRITYYARTLSSETPPKDGTFFFKESSFGNDVITTRPLPPIDGSPIQFINAGQLSFNGQVYPLYLQPTWYVEIPSFFADPPFSKPLFENVQIEVPFNFVITKTEEEHIPE